MNHSGLYLVQVLMHAFDGILVHHLDCFRVARLAVKKKAGTVFDFYPRTTSVF